MMLTLLRIFSDAQVANLKVSEGDNKERHSALISFLAKNKYGASNKSTYFMWATYILEGNG